MISRPQSLPTVLRFTSRLFAVPWVSAATFWLHVTVAVLALSRCCVGFGQLRIWVLAAVALPAARLVLDAHWRGRRAAQARSWWRACHDETGGEAGKWLAGFVFVGLPAGLLFCAHPSFAIASGDTWAVVPTAASLVREGDLDVREYVPLAPPGHFVPSPEFDGLPYGVMNTRAGVCSRYPAGMTLFTLPVVVVGRLAGAEFDTASGLAALDRFAAVLVAVVLVAAFFRVALLIGPPPVAVWVAALLAVGSGVYSTVSQTMWQHSGVMLAWLALFASERHPRLRASAWGRALFGLAAGVVFACRLNGLLGVMAVGLWTLTASPRRGGWNALASAIASVPVVAFHWAVYGTPLGPSSSQAAGANWTTDVGGALLGLLASPARGFIVYQPWAVLAGAGLLVRPRSGWKWACGGQAFAHLALVSAWGCWWGGSCWGSRLLTEMLVPVGLLTVPAVERLVRRKWGAWAMAAVVFVSAIPQFAGVWAFHTSANWNSADGSSMWNSPAWAWPVFL